MELAWTAAVTVDPASHPASKSVIKAPCWTEKLVCKCPPHVYYRNAISRDHAIKIYGAHLISLLHGICTVPVLSLRDEICSQIRHWSRMIHQFGATLAEEKE